MARSRTRKSPTTALYLSLAPTGVGVGLFVAGGGYTAALLGPAIYSIVDSPRAARRHDRRARELQLLLTPAPMAGPDRSSGLGLYLGGRF